MATKKKTTKKSSSHRVVPKTALTNLAICYLPLVGWIPAAVFLVLEKDYKLRWHAMQSLLLNGVVFGLVLLLNPLLGMLVAVAGLVLMLVLAVRVYNGQDLRLPVIAGWADKIVHRGS